MSLSPPVPPPYTVAVTDDKAGLRLDRILADALPDVSRTRVQHLIETGQVFLTGLDADHAVRDPARRARAGDLYHVSVPEPPPVTAVAQPMPLAVVYEDDHLIIVDKPAGLVVHPGAGTPDGTLVNALLAHCPAGLSSIGAPVRPGIVHRLDKDTSGLLVAAKTDVAHRGLAEQFARHTVERAYVAVVWGRPVPAAGRIDRRIGRSSRDRTLMAIVDSGGKPAITDYRTVRPLGGRATQLECRLSTGRTHQIRVHLAAAGHPLVGDPVYRGGRSGQATAAERALPACSEHCRRQALHAFLIGFDHPVTGEAIRFESEIPGDIKSLARFLESQ
jgi:pseudouridine synthase, RluA family